MTFKNWLTMSEAGTAAAAVAGPAVAAGPSAGHSSTLTTNVNNPPVPRKLFQDGPVRRKWMNMVGKTGLGGPLMTIKFNKS